MKGLVSTIDDRPQLILSSFLHIEDVQCAFHACNRGSTPRGDAINNNNELGNITSSFFIAM